MSHFDSPPARRPWRRRPNEQSAQSQAPVAKSTYPEGMTTPQPAKVVASLDFNAQYASAAAEATAQLEELAGMLAAYPEHLTYNGLGHVNYGHVVAMTKLTYTLSAAKNALADNLLRAV